MEVLLCRLLERLIRAHHGDERGNQFGIELRAGALGNLLQSDLPGQSLTIGTIARHSIESIRQSQDTGDPRDRFAGKTIRVAPSVPSFVMMAYAGERDSKLRRFADDYLAQNRVRLHDGP